MSLRTKVLRGGVYLFVRLGLGMAISTIGIILLTRTIGPGAYGLYAAVLGIYMYLTDLSTWGVEVYLIRREEEPQPQDYHQAFSLLLLLGSAVAGLAILALPLLEQWVRLEGFGSVAVAMFGALPVVLLGRVPLARLERALAYRRVALIELAAQMAFYLVALILAYRGLGVWAPIGGWWAAELLRLGLLYGAAAYRPRLHWESARVRAMVKYGLGYSASIWVWQLRVLVNPLVVGRYAGAEAVGYVALAIRIVEQLGFVKFVTWRLSIPALARMQEDLRRMVRAITEGITLQTMAAGVPLVAFSLAAPWIIPVVFGSRWLSVVQVYPFIALGYLANTMFSLHSSALYVLKENWRVTSFHLAHVALFAGSALLLVPYVGLRGYGWAEIAALPSYILIHIGVVARIGRPRYALAVIWFTAWAIPLLGWPFLGPWTLMGIVIPLIWPATRRELLRTVVMVWGTISTRK
jgi:O-antigen/teichoic acid export membrane protein